MTIDDAKWNDDTKVFVQCRRDWIDGGDTTGQIVAGPTVSADANYNGMKKTVDVTSINADKAGIIVSAIVGEFDGMIIVVVMV